MLRCSKRKSKSPYARPIRTPAERSVTTPTVIQTSQPADVRQSANQAPHPSTLSPPFIGDQAPQVQQAIRQPPSMTQPEMHVQQAASHPPLPLQTMDSNLDVTTPEQSLPITMPSNSGAENVALVGEDCCGTNAYSIVKQFCCNKTGKYTVINKTSSLNKSLNGESKCPGYRFAIKCGKTQLNGKKEPCCNSRVSKNDHSNGQTVCSQLEENTSRNQTMTERRKTRNRVRHGICRICSLNTNSLLSLIKKQKVSVCRKKVILLAVDTSNRIGRYWMLNVTAFYPNSTREGSAEFKLKVLLPCTKCSKLQSKVTNYLLLTHSRVVPGKLLRLGDSDFLFPNKTDMYHLITNQQAKCKDNRNVFVNALKKRMRRGLKKFLKELFQFKLR